MEIVFEPMNPGSKLLVTKLVFSKQENRDFMARRYGTYTPFVKKEIPAPKSVSRAVRPVAVRREIQSDDVSTGKLMTVGGCVFLASGCFLFLLAGGFGMSAPAMIGASVMLGYSLIGVMMQ